MCCFRGFFLENLHEFEGHFLSDLCVNKMVLPFCPSNFFPVSWPPKSPADYTRGRPICGDLRYLSFWHLLSSQQGTIILGNNKSLKKTLKTLLSLLTLVSGNLPIFEGFHRKTQIFEGFDTLEQHLLIFEGFRGSVRTLFKVHSEFFDMIKYIFVFLFNLN